MKIAIEPRGPVSFDVTVPGSKSLTNRALIAAAQALGHTRLTNASFSDDSRYLSTALNEVGVRVSALEKENVLRVDGGQPHQAPSLDGATGTGGSGSSCAVSISPASIR